MLDESRRSLGRRSESYGQICVRQRNGPEAPESNLVSEFRPSQRRSARVDTRGPVPQETEQKESPATHGRSAGFTPLLCADGVPLVSAARTSDGTHVPPRRYPIPTHSGFAGEHVLQNPLFLLELHQLGPRDVLEFANSRAVRVCVWSSGQSVCRARDQKV